MSDDTPLRHLSGPEVVAALPPIPEQLLLAERAQRALVGGAELPAKIGVHPRPDASWAHAMPAFIPDPGGDVTRDLLGVKFIAGFPANAGLGLPALHATLLLCDPVTGRPSAVLDAAPLTTARTAATTGVAVRAWGPSRSAPVVGLAGAGAQGASHVAVLAEVLPGCHLRIHDQSPGRAATLAERAMGGGAFASARAVETLDDALRGSDVAITMVSFGPERQQLSADVFADTALVVTVDYDMLVPAAAARDADLFLVDEVQQFLTNRAGGLFVGYRDPDGTIGEHLDGPRPSGRVLVEHLGTGVADLVFGDAVVHAAAASGLGTLLPG
jgi:ornithine cyclodeaminase/alanine dehydrogenase-like protein (mu-crystallin family)